MIITPSNLSALFTGYDTRFSAAQAQMQSRVFWHTMAMLMPSGTATNVYAWLAQLPKMREWLGERVVQNLTTNSYSLTNKDFELTLGISRNAIEDDQYNVYGPWVDQAGASAAKMPDEELALTMQAGTGASRGLCHDNQYFFDTDHPVDPFNSASGTQANLFTSKALTQDNYASVRASMMSLKGESGRPLGVIPDTLHVPPQLEVIARQICESKTVAVGTLGGQTQVGGQDNVLVGTAKVVVVPELANEPTVWYLSDQSKFVKPFIWQLREAPNTTYQNNPNDESVFMLNEYRYGVRARGAAGFGLWFLAARCIA